MAIILGCTSWLFCFRPISYIICKIFKNNYKVRAIFMELHYLILSIAYMLCLIFGLVVLLDDKIGLGIFLLIVGFFGTFGLGFGIFHYHKSDDDMMRDEYQHTRVTVDVDRGTATARDEYKTKLTGPAFCAVVCSVLNPIIRLLNLILTFVFLPREEYYNDLACNYHTDRDGTFKKIFLDNYFGE